MSTDQQAIMELVEIYREGFAILDAAKLQSIWDHDYPTIYCPIELKAPLHGRQAIEQYYDRVTQHLSDVHVMEIADLSIEIIGDVAWAFFSFRFEGALEGKSEPHSVEGRNTIIFRRKGNEWKGIHYHESKMGPY